MQPASEEEAERVGGAVRIPEEHAEEQGDRQTDRDDDEHHRGDHVAEVRALFQRTLDDWPRR